MPKLFDEIELTRDCQVIADLGQCGRVIPTGARGVLVDQNQAHPQVWIIEFSEPHSELILVEATEDAFRVAGSSAG